jgi:hypothetical protein
MNRNPYIAPAVILFVLICLTAVGVLASHGMRSGTARIAAPAVTSTNTSSTFSAGVNGNPPPQIIPSVVPLISADQSNHLWKRYHSARLGFSIDYPSDNFTPLDGEPQGEPDVVSFNKNGSSPADYSSIQLNVDATTHSSAAQDIAMGIPYTITTLSRLPAIEQEDGGSSCPECDIRFILVFKGYRYIIDIQNQPFNGPGNLSQGDIEHVRQSFQLD